MRMSSWIGIVAIVISTVSLDAADNVLVDAVRSGNRAAVQALVKEPGAVNAPLPDGNPWAGKFKVVAAPFLSNTSLTGNSTTGWYLLCAPSDFSIQEVNFLNSQRSPTVETGELSFSTLGYATRAYHDFSTNMLEYRGGVFSVGA